MSIKVLFFGATAAITGTSRLEMEKESTPSRELFDRVLKEYPALTTHRLLYSINQQYATGEEIVHDGDELAIFTAVSGG